MSSKNGMQRLAWASARTLLGALCGEGLRLRAMALTYISLFAIVPALVVAFSVVQAFTGMDALWRGIHGFLLDNLAVGARTSIEPYLDRFVRNAHATSAGLVGGALLVFSAVSLFGHVERAVNEIWKVRRPRPLAQRALIYWAGLTLGPFLLAGSLALGHAVGAFIPGATAGQLLARLAAALLSCTLFGALYFFVPATRVRLCAAATGGLVAGITWELAKALYAVVVARFFHYHAIYGSVATIPIFLVWLYVSWTLVLFGARVSFVAQHARVLLRGHPPEGQGTLLGRELLAARAMLVVALAYRDGLTPPDPGDVALRIETFGEPVREILGTLRAKRLVLELTGGGLVPARPLEEITLADVRCASSGQAPPLSGDSTEALVLGILAVAEGAAAEALSTRTYADLCALVAPRHRVALEEAAGRPNL
jgi:membrane protein